METPDRNEQQTTDHKTAIENEAGSRLLGMSAEERRTELSGMTPRAIAKATAGIRRGLAEYPVGGPDPRYYELGQTDSQIGGERVDRIREARRALIKLKDHNIEDVPTIIKNTPERILDVMHDQAQRANQRTTRPQLQFDEPWRLPDEIASQLETEVSTRSKAADRRDRGEILPEDWKRWAKMNDGEMLADMEALELPGLDAAKKDARQATPPVQQGLKKEVTRRENLGYYLAQDAERRPEKAEKWIPQLSSDSRELLHRGREMLTINRSGAGVAVRGAGRPAGDVKPPTPTRTDRTPSNQRTS